jgi:hypothetical protein
MNQVRVELLIERYLNGVLTEPERAELEQQLLAAPSARSLFWDHTQFHALIRRWGQEDWGRQLAAQPVAQESSGLENVVSIPGARGFRFHWWQPLAAAAALLAFVTGWFWLAQRETPASSNSAPAVAVLKRSVGVQWISRKDARSVGQMLAADWLRWREGTVQIDFVSGASLIVAGPAEVRLESENAALLQRGQASVYVPPPARGFVLRGPALDVTDLGTAFGLSVASNRPPEVHVFEGAVTFVTPGTSDAPRRIEAGHAMRVEASAVVEIPVRESDFPNLRDLIERASEEGRAHAAVWLGAMSRLAGEPGALLCYSFENLPGWTRAVTNLAANAQAGSPGTVVSAGWIAGRWAGTRALEYRSSGDRLRFDVPGAHGALTLMAWVRVDSLPNDYNALILPAHYRKGSLHWTLERDGSLRFALLRDTRRVKGSSGWEVASSAPAVSGMDVGRWVFLATTYDAATGVVQHYCDGQAVGRTVLKSRTPAVLGPASFGNWDADPSTPDAAWVQDQLHNQKVRNFVGRLDDLAILARALSAREIATLYESGKP